MPNKTSILALGALLFLPAASAIAQVAYVGNGSEYVISTVNEANGTAANVARVGLYGRSFSVSADGTVAAVAVADASGIDLVNLKTGAVTTPFAVSSISHPLISPDGSFVILSNSAGVDTTLIEFSTKPVPSWHPFRRLNFLFSLRRIAPAFTRRPRLV